MADMSDAGAAAALARHWAAVAAAAAGAREIGAARAAALAAGVRPHMLDLPPRAPAAPAAADLAGAVQQLSDATGGLADAAARLAGRRPPCAAPTPERGRKCRCVAADKCARGYCAKCCTQHHVAHADGAPGCVAPQPAAVVRALQSMKRPASPAGVAGKRLPAAGKRPAGKRLPAPPAHVRYAEKRPPAMAVSPGASSSEDSDSSE